MRPEHWICWCILKRQAHLTLLNFWSTVNTDIYHNWILPIVSRLKLAASEKHREKQNKWAKHQWCFKAYIFRTQQQISLSAAGNQTSSSCRNSVVPQGHQTLHKAIWQVIIPPSCPVERKTTALLLNLSVPTHTGMTPAGLQVSGTVLLCRS